MSRDPFNWQFASMSNKILPISPKIELANRLRDDSLIQKPSTDPNALNMIDGVIKGGNIKFNHTKG